LKKQKIYLDTSVVSHLESPDRPDWMADTLKLWELIKKGVYEVYISNTTIAEINDCNEPKRSFMLAGRIERLQSIAERQSKNPEQGFNIHM
jgi:predicted nucleic acid-binding protein